jgi:hypothetical protein
MQPDEVIPGSLPGEVMLVRTGQVAITIGSVLAYPNGFGFTAHVRRRGGDEDQPGNPDPFNRHGQRGQQDNALRLGILYADGRRGATIGGHWWPHKQDDPERLVVQPGGGGGNDRRWDGDFWVHPLPPDGPVTFVASWPEYGVPETRAQLDGSAIRTAAERAVILWPEQPEAQPEGSQSSQTITAFHPGEPGPSGAGTDS